LTNESERERWLKLPLPAVTGYRDRDGVGTHRAVGGDRLFLPILAWAIEMLFDAFRKVRNPPERALTVPVSIPTWIS